MAQPGRNERVNDSEILKEIVLSPDPIITASELAERLDYTRQNANSRLNSLVADGYVEKWSVGSRAVVYWITHDGRQKAAES